MNIPVFPPDYQVNFDKFGDSYFSFPGLCMIKKKIGRGRGAWPNAP